MGQEPPVQNGRPVDMPPAFYPQFWIALLLIAVGSGLPGGLLMRLFYFVQSLAWTVRGSDLYAALVAAHRPNAKSSPS